MMFMKEKNEKVQLGCAQSLGDAGRARAFNDHSAILH
jgi:hypothetical protein